MRDVRSPVWTDGLPNPLDELVHDFALVVDVAGSGGYPRGVPRLLGFVLGAIVGLLVAIGYDTSAEVAPLEGAHGHLSLGGVLVAGVVGAIVGMFAGHLAEVRRRPRR